MMDLMKQLMTFRVDGPTDSDRIAALERFGTGFLGKPWDVYAADLLSSKPV